MALEAKMTLRFPSTIGLLIQLACSPSVTHLERPAAVEQEEQEAKLPSSSAPSIQWVSRAPCRIGVLSASVPRLSLRTVSENPQSYYGRLVRVRGYFILAVENTVLIEPEHRQAKIYVNVQKLPADTGSKLADCKLKLVEVQGFVTHVPHRGNEVTTIFAQAMSSVK